MERDKVEEEALKQNAIISKNFIDSVAHDKATDEYVVVGRSRQSNALKLIVYRVAV